jgi:hypothetical protein
MNYLTPTDHTRATIFQTLVRHNRDSKNPPHLKPPARRKSDHLSCISSTGKLGKPGKPGKPIAGCVASAMTYFSNNVHCRIGIISKDVGC